MLNFYFTFDLVTRRFILSFIRKKFYHFYLPVLIVLIKLHYIIMFEEFLFLTDMFLYKNWTAFGRG